MLVAEEADDVGAGGGGGGGVVVVGSGSVRRRRNCTPAAAVIMVVVVTPAAEYIKVLDGGGGGEIFSGGGEKWKIPAEKPRFWQSSFPEFLKIVAHCRARRNVPVVAYYREWSIKDCSTTNELHSSRLTMGRRRDLRVPPSRLLIATWPVFY
jgi:hypothetical protein